MTTLSTIEGDILDVIPIGNEKKITIKEISQLIGVEERAVYDVIYRLRTLGVPICAMRSGDPADRGYFIATTNEERASGLAAYKSQVINMVQLINEIENADLNDWRSSIQQKNGTSGDHIE